MFASLNRYVYARYAYALVAALALWVTLLTVSPAIANAEETPRANDPRVSNRGAAEYVVVAPGDSLWSISERQLGPTATGSQIARGVERLYALNRNQIGADPNAIYVGQAFVLPRSLERLAARRMPRHVQERPMAEPGAEHAGAPAARVGAGRTSQDTRSGPDRATGPAGGKSAGDSAGRVTKVPVDAHAVAAHEASALPDEAAVAHVPIVRSLAVDGTPSSRVSYSSGIRARVSSAASMLIGAIVTDKRYAGRQLLGWALIVVSISIGVFPLFLAMARAARRAMIRRERKKSLYSSGWAASPAGASPPDFEGPLREEKPVEATGPGPSEERDHSEDFVNSTNGGGATEALRKDNRPSGARQSVPQGAANRRRMNRRRRMGDEDPRVSGARGGWDIGEPLRHSLESCPLRLDVQVDEVLAELKPQVEDDLRSVELLERRRRLSEREQHQASALRDLLAIIQESPNNGRRA